MRRVLISEIGAGKIYLGKTDLGAAGSGAARRKQ